MSDATNAKTATEVRRLRKMLYGISQLAEHVCLIGAMQAGAPDAIAMYNKVLDRLEELEIAPLGFFAHLPEHADFDRLGVNARLLSDYIKDDEFVHAGHAGHPNVVIGSLAGLDGLGDLKDIGSLVRTKLAGIFNDDPECAAKLGKGKVKVEVKIDRKDGSEEETIREENIG